MAEKKKKERYTRAEIKAGVMLTIALIIFIVMLFTYGRFSRLWQGRLELKVLFTSVSQLRPEAPVRFNGVEVGRVKDTIISRLDDEELNLVRPPGERLFTERDLDNLPLQEFERLELKNLARRLREQTIFPVPQAKATVHKRGTLPATSVTPLALSKPPGTPAETEAGKAAPAGAAKDENGKKATGEKAAGEAGPKKEKKNSAGGTLKRTLTPDEAARKLDRACRDKVRGRTMIMLVLEVRGDQEQSNYHMDDQVRINTTLLGDTSVEIVSGHGKILTPDSQCLILGVSGDFFSNLARSVEQVKEILGSVSEVIGPRERQSIRRALRRFDPITKNIEEVTVLINKRLPKTWDKLDGLADQAHGDLETVGRTVRDLTPSLRQTLADADAAVLDLRKRIGALADSTGEAVGDLKTRLRPVLNNVRILTDRTKDDVPVLVRNVGDLAKRLQTSADKLDTVLAGTGRLVAESYPDLRRLVVSLRMTAENAEEATALLKRRPWLIYNVPKEPKDFEKARELAVKLGKATSRFKELVVQLQALRRTLPEKGNKTALDRTDFLIRELSILTDALEYAGDRTRKLGKILPPFNRKRFFENPENYDPIQAEKDAKKNKRLLRTLK